MLEELRWKASLTATGLYQALRRAEGIPAAEPLAGEAIGPAADALAREIVAASLPALPLLRQLTALAAEFDNSRELLTRAMNKLHLGPIESEPLTRIAGALTDLRSTLLRAQPQLADELAVRAGPLREQWEARGPGMLRGVAGITESAVIPLAAEIVLVSPYAGGGGIAHPAQNRVTFEAMLFHPLPSLPETVRLAWLLTQLNGELPRFQELIRSGRLERTFAAAMVAPTLAAAQEVELGACDEPALAFALEAWGLAPILPDHASTILWNWWTAWLEQSASWPVAVAALDQMLA
jgi:hypothetical protein